MSLTPPLCNMLSDDLLMRRYRAKLEKLLELAEKEVVRARSLPSAFQETAEMYRTKFRRVREIFDACGGRLLTRFKALQDAGLLEIITCGATHGYLPLMIHEESRRAQIRIAPRTISAISAARPGASGSPNAPTPPAWTGI
jgi:1,4-alpha-glucan branching enzyme